MQKKYKVLHISTSGNLYGTERHILSIVKYSDKEKFEHWVSTPNKGYFNEVLDSLGIKHIIAGRIPHPTKKVSGFLTDNSYKSLVKHIRKEKFDIIHSHLISYGGFTGKIFSKAKIFHTRHGVFWSEDELKAISASSRSFQRIKNAMFDITIAIGEYEKKTMIKYLGYDEKKIRLTFNGVTTDEIVGHLDNSANKESLYGTKAPIVGAVGRLERQKGFHYFVEAAARVSEKYPDVQYVIVGDGSLRDELTELIKSLGLENKFHLITFKQNIFDYIKNMDIVVQTSLWEGISYSVLEPMALSKPVIALSTRNTSGVKEIIIEGKTGHLIFENYVEEMGNAIKKLLDDRTQMTAMGEAGFNRVKDFFTELRTAQDMDRYYLESLQSNKQDKRSE